MWRSSGNWKVTGGWVEVWWASRSSNITTLSLHNITSASPRKWVSQKISEVLQTKSDGPLIMLLVETIWVYFPLLDKLSRQCNFFLKQPWVKSLLSLPHIYISTLKLYTVWALSQNTREYRVLSPNSQFFIFGFLFPSAKKQVICPSFSSELQYLPLSLVLESSLSLDYTGVYILSFQGWGGE